MADIIVNDTSSEYELPGETFKELCEETHKLFGWNKNDNLSIRQLVDMIEYYLAMERDHVYRGEAKLRAKNSTQYLSTPKEFLATYGRYLQHSPVISAHTEPIDRYTLRHPEIAGKTEHDRLIIHVADLILTKNEQILNMSEANRAEFVKSRRQAVHDNGVYGEEADLETTWKIVHKKNSRRADSHQPHDPRAAEGKGEASKGKAKLLPSATSEE